MAGLVIAAAVEDYIAANAARQAFLRLANAALWIHSHLHRSPIFSESTFPLCGGYAVYVGHVRCLCVYSDVLSPMKVAVTVPG